MMPSRPVAIVKALNTSGTTSRRIVIAETDQGTSFGLTPHTALMSKQMLILPLPNRQAFPQVACTTQDI